ncbi:tRNA (guanine-N1)-methyltransferase [Robiginitalea sp. M366]|uniref:tRNA (guanine-N1)-methyltransferase n=1 Tax=Robiginitalea aestuariiviva TaxID=3036903 RepID=UPI00240DE851|nr:tRNA (guanine-N1)-methyltransferase [Robiginitalea aestuariiviva]MDG1573159.1 tRNA (guanine-N1)-methyltransferase [Robiginitalea aestuariiviva]
MKFSTLFLFAALFGMTLAQAQDADDTSLDGGTIESQFEYIFDRSGNYSAEGRRYEVVRAISLDKLRNNVLDSLNAARRGATELQATISNQQATITDLNSKLEDTTARLTEVTEEKDSMSFFGAQLSKATYNIILWTIIIGLTLLLFFFIYRFRSSNTLTQEAKSKLADLELEYENHRRRALEREQRISRQLQDEINKYKKGK